MQVSQAVHYPRYGMRFRLTRNLACGLSHSFLAFTLCGAAMAQSGPLVLERPGRVISLEPYAPNILRVTMSTDQAAAAAAAGYGFVAAPSSAGWTHERDRRGLRCVPFRADGGACGAGRSARRPAAAADAARRAEPRAAPPLF